MVGVVNARHFPAARSRAAAVRARPALLGLDDLLRVGLVTFMGNALQVAAVCIRAPSCSISDLIQEMDVQTESGVIGFVRCQAKALIRQTVEEYKYSRVSIWVKYLE